MLAIPHSFLATSRRLGAKVLGGEPLARHTTFRIGGPADLYAALDRPDDLPALAELALSEDLPVTVLGGGSNVLISDAGVRGLTILNTCRGVRIGDPPPGAPELAPDQVEVVAEAGGPLAGLARWTMRHGLSGLEWAVSVPGTIGGAVVGNAGAHGGDIAGSLAWALVAHPGRGRRFMTPGELAYAYRTSLLKQELASGQCPIVLSAGFHMLPGDPAVMSAVAADYLARRRSTQPVEASAGSIFRNPPGDFAGRLVEAAGLKGFQIGGAMVSTRHANFIVNDGNARAADVLALIDLIRARVYAQAGLELLPEILFLGDWPSRPPYAPLSGAARGRQQAD